MDKLQDLVIKLQSVSQSPVRVIGAIFLSAALIVFIHRHLLPQPIPGIPYDVQSAGQILGDIPDARKWSKHSGEPWSFYRQRALELDSPIFQLFMKGPLDKPWVIITDFRESHDIQTARQGEFDRSAWLGDLFSPLVPRGHVWMESNEEFRANRSLLRDTMSPAFLNNLAAPAIHIAVSDWLQLWHEKIRLAQGWPFSADQDIVRGVVDTIFLISLGKQLGLSKAQTELLSSFDEIKLPAKLDTPTIFPVAQESETYTEFRTLGNSLAIGLSTPWPRTTLNLALKVFPSLVSARRRTDKAISEVLQGAWERLSRGQGAADQAKCAADLMVLREAQLAKKQDRKFHYDTQTIRDELFGIYLSGQDSTSTSTRSAMKRLTEHQDMQQKLRSALRAAYPDATEAGRPPTAREIIETTVPYLDAFIEENHRLNPAVATVVRRATRDAIVLGHRIPKGTDVFMMLNGPSFQVPALPVDEAARSGTSREAKDRYGVWKDEDVSQFMPERFLVRGENGNISFNPSAGPVLPYGSGLRGCFGIRLAVLQLRIIITLIVWDFELRSIPPALSTFHGKMQQTYLRLAKV